MARRPLNSRDLHVVETWRQRLLDAPRLGVLDLQGASVPEVEAVRRKVRARGGQTLFLRNDVSRAIFAGSPRAGLAVELRRPTAFILPPPPTERVEPPSVFFEVLHQDHAGHSRPRLVAIWAEDRAMEPVELEAEFAALEATRQELRRERAAQIMTHLQGSAQTDPALGLATLLELREAWRPTLESPPEFTTGRRPRDHDAPGWYRARLDPGALFGEGSPIRLRPGWTFDAYAYREPSGGNGVVYAVPEGSSGIGAEALRGRSLFKPPRPARAVPFWEALEGDGTPRAYLHAALLLLELPEFGAWWHGVSWWDHALVDAAPPGEEWTWEQPEGEPLAPSAGRLEDGSFVVTFCSCTTMITVALTRWLVTFRQGELRRPEIEHLRLACGGPGGIP